jgi:hypothetical protein
LVSAQKEQLGDEKQMAQDGKCKTASRLAKRSLKIAVATFHYLWTHLCDPLSLLCTYNSREQLRIRHKASSATGKHPGVAAVWNDVSYLEGATPTPCLGSGNEAAAKVEHSLKVSYL